MSVVGKVAVVTGGARGIGAAISDGLAAGGAKVAICDINAQAAADTAARFSETHGATVIGVGMDVTNRVGVDEAFAAIGERLGPIDVLVNNAGIDVMKLFIESTEDEWDRVISVNLKGTIICCRAVLDSMIERQRGKIVNIGSDAGRVGSSTEAVYSATKGGVIAFTKTLARELARHSINVNCVCPGPTDTSLLDQLNDYNPKIYAAMGKAVPMRRIGQPSDLAPAIVFLAGNGSDYITGQTLSVSGGLTMC
jgi:2-hydroxycyclohexanecarboxyl-CoA dehydrogenase